MQRTAHASSAVRAYKCVGEKLRGVTSNVINGSGDIKDESKEGNEVEVEKQGKPKKRRSCYQVLVLLEHPTVLLTLTTYNQRKE